MIKWSCPAQKRGNFVLIMTRKKYFAIIIKIFISICFRIGLHLFALETDLYYLT